MPIYQNVNKLYGMYSSFKYNKFSEDEMEDMVKNAKKKNYINEIFNIRNNHDGR